MERGDHIYVLRSGYAHHGIYVGNGRVIHYSKPELGPAVIAETSLEEFAEDGEIYRKDYESCLPPEEVVRRAQSRLGETDYNLLSNNCEHFATWCKVGESSSGQVWTAAVAGTVLLGTAAVVAATRIGTKVATDTGEKVLARAGGKLLAKTTGSAALKTAANPALLAADAAQIGTRVVFESAGMDPEDAETASTVVGAGTSIAIGVALGGPVGGIVGAAVWGAGELLSSLFD